MKKLICFGDSVTTSETFENGTARLAPRLRCTLQNFQIINASMPENNTFDALNRIEKDVLNHNPDLVTVFFRANDAAFHKIIYISSYEENIKNIVTQITPQKTNLISPSPVNEVVYK